MNEAERLSLLKQLTLAEKVELLSGKGMWVTGSVPRLGIPALKVTDGPNGARGDGASGKTAASFPVGICLASTWNRTLLAEVGVAIGQEAKSKNAQVLLGPTINLHRTPIGGRNFECYGEDPLLTGELAAAFVNGVQSQGVGACIKHFVCNDTEYQRHTISSELDERTLREIYLRPFEIAVKRARPWALMSAYNRVNGTYASSHARLLRDVLREEWGFDGVVISDWGAALETVHNLNGGLDLEMPGPTRTRGQALVDAASSGAVAESLVDDAVLRMLRLMEDTGRFAAPDPVPEEAVDRPAHRVLARRAAAEGMVLIRNEGLLPLDFGGAGKVAVIGPNALRGQIQGGGSSGVSPHYQVMPFEAISAALSNAGNKPTYAVGCHTHKYVPLPPQGALSVDGQPGMRLRCFHGDGQMPVLDQLIQAEYGFIGGLVLGGLNGERIAHPFTATLEADFLPEQDGEHEVGLLSAGLTKLFIDDELVVDNWEQQTPGDSFFGMGSAEQRARVSFSAGRSVRLRIQFASVEALLTGLRFGILAVPLKDLISEAVEVAAGAESVVLVVGTSADWESEGNDRGSLALPGEQQRLIEAVLDANPRTVVVINAGAAVEMPWLQRAAAVVQAWLPGQEFGNALVDVLTGAVNPSGRMATTFPSRLEDTPAYPYYPGEDGKSPYGEGLLMGYRWYDAQEIEPLVPFGHGLSYTRFAYSGLEIERRGGVVTVRCSLANVGERAGQEVVQVYVGPTDSVPGRPVLELKAFDKVHLEAGEQTTATLTIAEDDLAWWSLESDAWTPADGSYRVAVGASSRDVRLVGELVLP